MKRHRFERCGIPAAALALLLVSCSEDPGPEANLPPTIREIVARPPAVVLEGQTQLTALASDANGDVLAYCWEAASGTLSDPRADDTFWTAPDSAGVFTVTLTVSDGRDSVMAEVALEVGEGSLLVDSDPPGAAITINGEFVLPVTPHRFETLPVGSHRITLQSEEFVYADAVRDVEIVHGDAESLLFVLSPSRFETLDLGRDDIEEIGTVTYLATGTGVLYTAVTTAGGQGVYSSAITPRRGDPNGVKLTEFVALNEPIAVYGNNAWLVLTSPTGTLLAAELSNPNGDGVIDSLGGFRVLDAGVGYGVTVADTRLAFSNAPSDDPESSPVLWTEFTPPTTGPVNVASLVAGRRPSWRPDGNALAFQRDGRILRLGVQSGTVSSPDTLLTEGHCRYPAWGKWGPRHIAYFRSFSEEAPAEVRFQAPNSAHAVTVLEGLVDPRGLAWSPAQIALAVTRNTAAGGEMLLVFDLPIPF